MSQRLPASRPAPRSPTDGRRIFLPPVQLRDDAFERENPSERLRTEAETYVPHAPLQATQNIRPAVSKFEQSLPTRTRDVAVHSMLNPTFSNDSKEFNRPFSESVETKQFSIGSRFPTTPHSAHSGQNVPYSNTQVNKESSEGNLVSGQRRTVNPRSPSHILRTGVSVTPENTNTLRSPFLPPRRAVENIHDSILSSSSQGSSILAHPITGHPITGQQSQYYYGYSNSVPPPASSNSHVAMRSSISQQTSPNIATTPYTLSAKQSSPISALAKNAQISQSNTYYYPGSRFDKSNQPQAGVIKIQGALGNSEGPYSAPNALPQSNPFHSSSSSSSRQMSASDLIQVLTLTTSQGSYTLPVDVHHASRLADEKRARNAGASARFRQRRKEKEIEANTAIEKLQTQVRDLEKILKETQSERNFYRSERDRLRDAVLRAPEANELTIQSPPSPVTCRSPTSTGHMAVSTSLETTPLPPRTEDPNFERAPRRRRTHFGGEFIEVSTSTPSDSSYLPALSGSSTRETNQSSQNQHLAGVLHPDPRYHPTTLSSSTGTTPSVSGHPHGPYDPSYQGG